MQPFVIYLNELSCPASVAPDSNPEFWRKITQSLYEGLRALATARKNFSISIPKGEWNSLFNNRPLCNWLEEWLGRDQYRWLASKARLDDSPLELSEIRIQNGRTSVGMSLADSIKSWTVSFCPSDSEWDKLEIPATKFSIDIHANSVEEACLIKNIGTEIHGTTWRDQLRDWGQNIAITNEIAVVSGNPIDMYPHDHGYPHVHLVSNFSPRPTIAKYRVDIFSRMEGPDSYDREMKAWIELNKEQLMHAWERCKRGEHPYKI